MKVLFGREQIGADLAWDQLAEHLPGRAGSASRSSRRSGTTRRSRPPCRFAGRLRDAGSAVTVIAPDLSSLAAIGANPLDPATRTPAAQAGRAQGLAGLAANAAG